MFLNSKPLNRAERRRFKAYKKQGWTAPDERINRIVPGRTRLEYSLSKIPVILNRVRVGSIVLTETTARWTIVQQKRSRI